MTLAATAAPFDLPAATGSQGMPTAEQSRVCLKCSAHGLTFERPYSSLTLSRVILTVPSGLSARTYVRSPPLTAAFLALLSSHAVASDWLQFGFDPSHKSNNSEETIIDAANVNTLVQLYSVALPSSGDGAPVYLSGASTPTGTKDLLFVTSFDGHIFSIDASNGSILWSKQPAPSPYAGNTSSTPAIDPDRQFVYSYGLDGKIHKFAVGDGTEVVSPQWPVVSTLKPSVEHSASALAIGTPVGGPNYLYAVTNGYLGDAGDYQGHVTTIDLTTGSSKVFNANCSKLAIHFVADGTTGVDDCSTPRSGIWGRSGAVYDAGTNRMYVTSANGNYNANVGGYNWGDTVLALPPSGGGDTLGDPIDSYTPTNFLDLDLGDADLGSGSLAILPTPATSKFSHLGVVMGKDGIVRLLNLDDMSGSHGPRFVGGELQALSVGTSEATAQPAVWVNTHGDLSTWIFVAPSDNLRALKLTFDAFGTPSLIQQWTALVYTQAVSPIIANDVLYAVNNAPLGGLQAFDPTSGSILWSASPFVRCCGWGQPIVINGRLYVLGGYNPTTLTVFALDSIFKDRFE